MQLKSNKKLLCALILSVTLPNISWAESEPLQQRVERLERIIQGQGLMNLISRVDQLQNEVKRLNGENESLRHELEQSQKRQREMYIDLDERLQQVTSNSVQPNSTAGNDASNPVDESASDSAKLSTAPVAVENGEAAYQAALQTLRSGQYQQAIDALAVFPDTYPGSVYLPNAYYWQGEANYVLRHFEAAITAFQTVIDTYPASTKVADSMLKLGFSQYELGNVDAAKLTLNNVMQQYSNTSAAKLSKVRLDRIKEETR
ncbi:hypothetical protein LCGC14_0675320 [marine sediment metagenome]|uniref:YbgF trimerisation domain-containing protein n=1 Tax=marine sediment metagenome TaxID=412755 RepID=A0A0F9QPV2_9ZZZZ